MQENRSNIITSNPSDKKQTPTESADFLFLINLIFFNWYATNQIPDKMTINLATMSNSHVCSVQLKYQPTFFVFYVSLMFEMGNEYGWLFEMGNEYGWLFEMGNEYGSTSPTSRHLNVVVWSPDARSKQTEDRGTLLTEESTKIDETTPSTMLHNAPRTIVRKTQKYLLYQILTVSSDELTLPASSAVNSFDFNATVTVFLSM